jgi:predicted RNA-binding Zn-ribbon protein involved in translation (DUF1610 family)
MPVRRLSRRNPRPDEDWEGNNAAVTCPMCGKVFIVSSFFHRGSRRREGVRKCPNCGRSTARVKRGKKSGGTASIKW